MYSKSHTLCNGPVLRHPPIPFYSLQCLKTLQSELCPNLISCRSVPLFTVILFSGVAALCDENGCLGLAGFIQVMYDQIRTFTKSSLADTSRCHKLKCHAASFCFYFSASLIVLALHVLFSVQLSFSRRNFLFAQRDDEIVDHGSAGL